MSESNKWYYEWNDGSHRPYDSNISQWLNNAKVGDNTVIPIHGNKYQIYKLSAQECTQTNIRTQFCRKGINQIKYDQIYTDQNNEMEIDDDTASHFKQQEWLWEDNDGTYKQYQTNISLELNKLKIGQSYIMQHGRNKYEIKKISDDKCMQRNMKTKYSRNVTLKVNDQNTYTNKWCWKSNNGNFVPYSDDICIEIDKLKPEESYFVFANNTKYQIVKISKDKSQQNNTQTNFTRDVVRRRIDSQSPQETTNENTNNRNYESKHDDDDDDDDDDDKKDDITKWYYEDDNGQFKPIEDWLSLKINNLVIGEVIKQKIKNALYELKKTSIGKGQQTNIRSNKKRQIRIAEYGWFFEDNDKSLKPYSDYLNKRLNSTVIGSSFTFSLKNNTKYSVRKVSKNTAKQRNLSTNLERNVVYKMTLNDDSTFDGISIKNGNGKDWLQQRYNKAMKLGKIDRVKLTARRNLKEDSAESHFRRCESQFMRSCQNMGAAANGLNKTITEVEYIINPKLIKRFETKKQALMKKNKCDEKKLNIVLAWHGTKAVNLKNIVENNFAMSKVSANTGNKGYYGQGIYFSEFSKTSAAYGDGLLLCKVMLGKQYHMNSGKIEMGRSLAAGYDSHIVLNGTNKQYGQEVVIFDVDQILPCYIIKY